MLGDDGRRSMWTLARSRRGAHCATGTSGDRDVVVESGGGVLLEQLVQRRRLIVVVAPGPALLTAEQTPHGEQQKVDEGAYKLKNKLD